MGAFTYIETDTGTNVDIHAATAIGTYTSTGDKMVMCDVSIDAVAGNGDYVMYVTRQIGGSGSAYRILPQTTMAAASGLTAISAQSGWITVRNGDVLTCYVVGLAGDTTTPDWSTRWFELAGVTAAAVADAVWDEATADHTTATSFGSLDANVDAILADTNELQTDLVNGGRLDLLIDSIITHLTQIKGAAWGVESLRYIGGIVESILMNTQTIDDFIDTEVAAIKAKTDLIPATPASSGEYTAAIAAIQADLDNPNQYKADVSGLATSAELSDVEDNIIAAMPDEVVIPDGIALETSVQAIKDKTDNLPATPASAGEYTAAIAAIPTTPLLAANYVAPDNASIAAILVDTGTTLDTLIKDIPTNAELATALGTADDAVLAAVAAAKSVIDNIHDTDLPAVKAETALILEDTGTTLPATLATIAGYTDGIAGDVWSHATRTLTVPAVAMSDPNEPTTLMLYRDADINIEFTGLTIPTGAKKVVFTIKDNLDDADTLAVLQATYELTSVPAETHTLNYINSAVPPTLTTPVTFRVDTDSVEFDMTAAAAYYLPRYERGYLNWDLKLITATTVQILQQGLVQILGTSTRTVA